MTVLHDMADRIKGFDAGADDFLSKPVHREELLARIQASLRRKATIDRRVDAMHQHVRSATARKSHFLAQISHELRTKLDAIIGFSEVLQEQSSGVLNARQAEYLNYILASGTDLLTDVNSLLEMAHIEMSETTLQLRTLPLQPVLEECLGLVRGHAQAHDITLSLAVDDAVSHVVGDDTQLKQMIFNLLSIAVTLTPDDGHVGIEVRQTAQAIQIAVWKTGMGMVLENQQWVLEVFGQPWAAVMAQTVGAGWGLARTKRLAELHGGMIDVRQRPGQGVTFTLSLPVPAPPIDSPPSAD
jgi:signal transduction histidine kinase